MVRNRIVPRRDRAPKRTSPPQGLEMYFYSLKILNKETPEIKSSILQFINPRLLTFLF